MMFIESIIYDSIYHATPILLCVLGGIFAYKANILNIALEGMMLAGAFSAILFAYLTNSVLIGVTAALVTCLIIGFIFSVVGVTFKGNVIIVGLAINMLVPAIAGFVLQFMQTSNITLPWLNISEFKLDVPLLSKLPIIGSIFSGQTVITYIAFISIILVYILMYKTKFGIYVRVVGESEEAARSLGINVNKYRYLAIILGAFFCALAGINLSLERLGLFTNNMTAGRGFIAIAAIYCGQGDPLTSSLYAIAFGFARALSVNLSLMAGPAAALFDVIPYLVMSLVLTVVSVIKYRNNNLRGILK